MVLGSRHERSTRPRRYGSAPAYRGARHRAGRGLSARSSTALRPKWRSPAGCATTPRGVTIEVQGDAPVIELLARARARRSADARRASTASMSSRARRGCRRRRLRHPRQRRRPRGHRDRARQRRLRRLPRANCSIRPTAGIATRSSTARTAARATRSPARLPYDRATHQHGGVRAVPGVPRRIPRAARSPLPRGAQRLPGLRPAARAARCARDGRCAASIRSPRRCARSRAARSSRSRVWAASTSPATRAMRTRVARLRERKSREEKPFAVMVANAASLAPLGRSRAPASARCSSRRERPIVLLRKRAGGRRCVARRCAGARLAGRDAAVHAAALPAVPRGGGAARGHARGSTRRRASCW